MAILGYYSFDRIIKIVEANNDRVSDLEETDSDQAETNGTVSGRLDDLEEQDIIQTKLLFI